MKSLRSEKILIGPSSFSALDRSPIDRLRQTGCEIIDNPFKRRLSKPELLDLLSDGITGLIAGLEPLDREALEKSTLKVISRCGAGLSNVDLRAAQELSIKVCSTPDAPTAAVAELTIGALLSMLRMIPEMSRDLHEGKWAKRIGTQIRGKTVLIIGFGRIGRYVAKLLVPFEAKILASDPLLQGIIDNITISPLEKVLPMADIISIHSSGENCVLGSNEFAFMKKGVFLLNAARGNAIDEDALIKALKEKKVNGAWIDTFKQEPYSGPLKEYPQVILTPHEGSYTRECRKSMEVKAVENLIKAFKEGDKDENRF